MAGALYPGRRDYQWVLRYSRLGASPLYHASRAYTFLLRHALREHGLGEWQVAWYEAGCGLQGRRWEVWVARGRK